MPKQGEALPAELLRHLQHVMNVIPDCIAGPGRPVIGVTVPGEIQCDDAQPRQLRRQPGETRGVVQPAVQGDHRLAVWRAIQMRRQLDMRQAQAHFLEQRTHADSSLSGWPAQRLNNDLSSSAVSCGRSRGNMCPPGSVRYSPFAIRRINRV
ncbi:hypothetical protein FQZ97_974530 [compost metagenome]